MFKKTHKTEQKQKDLDQEDQQILNRKSQRKPHTGVTVKLLKITEKENLESSQRNGTREQQSNECWLLIIKQWRPENSDMTYSKC